MHIGDLLIMRLSSVEETGHVIQGALLVLLGTKDVWHKFLQTRGVVFFIHHVEASNQIRVGLLSNTDVVQNLCLERMWIADHLVAYKDQTQLKVGMLCFHLISHLDNELKFLQDCHFVFILVE